MPSASQLPIPSNGPINPNPKMPPNGLGRLALVVAIVGLFALRQPAAGVIVAVVAGLIAVRALKDHSKSIGTAVAALTIGSLVLIISLGSGIGSAFTKSVSADAEYALSSSEPSTLSAQEAFISTVQQAAISADGVQNDLKIDKIVAERDQAVCEILGSQDMSGWSGTITDIGADALKYQGHLTVEIAPDITVGTWNNAFSDIGDDTLIERESAVFEILSDYDVGDRVTFDGTLLKGEDGACVTGKNSSSEYGTSPEFLAKFTAITTG